MAPAGSRGVMKMRGNILRAVVKALDRGRDPRPLIVSFFREYADYSMDEKELERALRNALEMVDFVRKNRISPGPLVGFEHNGEVMYVQYDGLLGDGRRIIVENSDDYELKRRFARPGDLVVRVEKDFSIRVLEVVE